MKKHVCTTLAATICLFCAIPYLAAREIGTAELIDFFRKANSEDKELLRSTLKDFQEETNLKIEQEKTKQKKIDSDKEITIEQEKTKREVSLKKEQRREKAFTDSPLFATATEYKWPATLTGLFITTLIFIGLQMNASE